MNAARALGFAVILSVAPATALAQTAASPSPSPAPGFSLRVQGANVFITQGESGPGLSPPEATQFKAGLPISPMSPYDWFTGAVQTPGTAGEWQYLLDANDRTPSLTFDAQFLAGAYAGDTNGLMYWGEPWMGRFDPHEGRSPLNGAIEFPAAAGAGIQTGAAQAQPYQASIASNDGAWKLSGGYVNVSQSDGFVFDPPAVTNVDPSIGISTAESLGPGMPNVAAWTQSPSTLPLLGADLVATRGASSMELTDALLPALQGTQARLTVGSYAFTTPGGGRFSAEVSNIATSGDPITTTTYFGADQTLYPGAQGSLVTSLLADQVQTLAGIRGFFHPRHGDDALFELGEGWYHEGLAAEPGTQHPGSYEHFEFTRHFNAILDAGLEYYRFDPRYADAILPYGVPENVWSVAWSWPGQWLKSTYQAVNDSVIGINREGYRVHADYARGRLEAHTDAYVWRQIAPATESNASQEGWIDGYFLPQAGAAATLGWQRQVALYAAWHWASDDLVLDSVWDRSYRPALDRVDLVSMNYPQAVGSWQHHWGSKMVAAVGYGRYSANGMWSTTPVQGIYGEAFAGGEWDFSHGQQLLVQIRRYALTGLPSEPSGPPPALRGTALIVDQRVEF